MKTFNVKQGVWGGMLVHPVSTSDAQIEALYHFSESIDSGTDLQTSVFQFHYDNPSQSISYVANSIANTAGIANPPLLENFTSIPNPLVNTLRLTTLTDITTELGGEETYGHRQLMAEITFKNDIEMMKLSKQIFDAGMTRFGTVKGFQKFWIYQPVQKKVMEASEKAGGNMLGLKPEDGNLVWATMVVSWDDEVFDEVIEGRAQDIVAAIKQVAEWRGVYHPL